MLRVFIQSSIRNDSLQFTHITLSSDSMIKSLIIDDNKGEDLRNDRQHRDVKWANYLDLQKLGIVLLKLNGEEINEDVEKFCKERNYKIRDQKQVSANLPNNEDLRVLFAKEHIHADEEIKYFMKGSGYFDIRSNKDEWIRIQVTRGDLLVLPEGIYHRYVNDITNYIHLMRFFQDEPK
jgi:1,2-dihydroxy-3-keto-5-methylthiopentene dioxygenase